MGTEKFFWDRREPEIATGEGIRDGCDAPIQHFEEGLAGRPFVGQEDDDAERPRGIRTSHSRLFMDSGTICVSHSIIVQLSYI